MSKIFKSVFKFALGGGLLGTAVKALAGKKKAPATPLPQPNRDAARAEIEADDELRRRRGASADLMFGATGTEAGLGSIGKFNIPGS